MPKKISKKLFILIIAFQAVGFLFFAPTPMQAADMPNLKNPLDNLQVEIPGLKDLATKYQATCQEINGEQKCQLPWIGVYISSLYKYGIGIVGILAAVVLMVGGIIWLTAGGNQTRVGEAKAWIGASLTGLIIALTSYMILYQVNPSLTQFRPVEMTVVKSTGQTGQKVSDIDLASDSITRGYLKNNFININKENCKTATDTNCTSVANLPQQAVDGLINLKNACNCSITITGGTEAGHKSHGPNIPIVDLRLKEVGGSLNSDLLVYIHDKVGLGWGEKINYYDGAANTKYNATDNSFSVIRELNDDGSEHFHMVFN